MTLRLHNFFRNSAGHRVRIALALKGLDYEYVSVNIGPASEQKSDAYLKLNPQGLVPTLEHDGRILTQSLAIIEYLDEIHPEPPLLPESPAERARIRKIAMAIVADTHALNVQRVSKYMANTLGIDQNSIRAWRQYWMTRGLGIIETFLHDDPQTGTFCHGDSPTVADTILVPQVYTSQHYGVDLSKMPTVKRIYDHCLTLPAFQKAKPENQPDYNRDGRETKGRGH